MQQASTMQEELDALLKKREKIHARIMERFRNHNATRARTTTGNAEVGRLNERIVWLREQLKSSRTE